MICFHIKSFASFLSILFRVICNPKHSETTFSLSHAPSNCAGNATGQSKKPIEVGVCTLEEKNTISLTNMNSNDQKIVKAKE